MRLVLSVMFAVVWLLPSVSLAEDWPEFRGPSGQGISTTQGLPIEWSDRQNIRWQTPLAGAGWSSPAIVGGQIWLTSAENEGHLLKALCLDLATGKVVHELPVFEVADPGSIHGKNSHASPTPIIAGDRVFVHFGTYGTACLSTSGDILWKNSDLKFAHGHGPGGSPVLYEDLLIFNCDGTDQQFVVALRQSDGQVVWKTPRQGAMAYSTPLVIQVGGADQLISVGGEWVVSYKPKTGEEIWRCRYPGGYSNVPRPVFGKGLVFVSSGYNTPVLYAIRPDGEGDVTETHVEWQLQEGAPLNPSPLCIGDELYLVSDGGIASCLDAATGTEHWKQRLKGAYSASPLFAGGKIYFLNEEGLATVVNAGVQFKKLKENTLPGRTLASFAVADGALFVRTDSHLYRIQKK